MSIMPKAPLAEGVRLGLNTAATQRPEITPQAAAREIPDNLIGISAGMTRLPTSVGVPMVAFVQNITTRKGETLKDGRMMTVATQTPFLAETFKRHLSVVEPKANGKLSHQSQVHGMGTSNATIALGHSDCSGQSLIICRTARAAGDPVALTGYPVKVKALRYGRHANEMYCQETGNTGRATLQGDLMIYPDTRPGGVCKVPYVGSFVGYSDESVPEPETARAFLPYLNKFSHPTQFSLLDDSKWALDESQPVPASDLCDELLTDVHAALQRLASSSGQSYEDVLASDAVVYFFWDLRDEVQERDGVILVDGVALHEKMADSYLPHNSPTREVLLSEKKVHMPDPTRTHMTFGANLVDFEEGHWLLQQLAAGELCPVSYEHGYGKDKRVFLGKDFAVESYTCKPNELLKATDKDSVVVLHMRSGLAVGDKNAYLNGHVVKSTCQDGCVDAKRALDLYMRRQSLQEWPSKEGGKGNEFDRNFINLVPHTAPWDDDELKEVKDALAGLIGIYASNAKMGPQTRVAALANAKVQSAAWAADNPTASVLEKAEKDYEFHCRHGGAKLQTALKQVGYMSSGCGIVHMVTVFATDLPVDKSKDSILGETATALRICEELPRRNQAIMQGRYKELADWHAASLAEEEREAREANDRRQREKAERLAQRNADREGARKLKEMQAQASKVKEQAFKTKRMKAIGCCAKWVRGGEEVHFVSQHAIAGRKDDVVMVMDPAEAQRQLRAGTLRMSKGRGKGIFFIFKGRAEKGTLFTEKHGTATEIIVNQSPPPPPPPPPPTTTTGGGTLDTGDYPRPPPEPEYCWLSKTFESGLEFKFAVPSACCSDAYKAQLIGTAFNPALAAFAAAVESVQRVADCFQEGGGMPLVQPSNQLTRLRVVPVVRPDDGPALPANQHEIVDDSIKVCTVFVDVLTQTGAQTDGNVPKELAIAHLAYKIARSVASAYNRVTVRKGRVYDDALIGLLLAGSFGSGEMPEPHVVNGSQLSLAEVPVSRLGKRKQREADEADEADEAGEAGPSSNNGGAGPSSDNGGAETSGCPILQAYEIVDDESSAASSASSLIVDI